MNTCDFCSSQFNGHIFDVNDNTCVCYDCYINHLIKCEKCGSKIGITFTDDTDGDVFQLCPIHITEYNAKKDEWKELYQQSGVDELYTWLYSGKVTN